jgi:hypothetical protein
VWFWHRSPIKQKRWCFMGKLCLYFEGDGIESIRFFCWAFVLIQPVWIIQLALQQANNLFCGWFVIARKFYLKIQCSSQMSTMVRVSNCMVIIWSLAEEGRWAREKNLHVIYNLKWSNTWWTNGTQQLNKPKKMMKPWVYLYQTCSKHIRTKP